MFNSIVYELQNILNESGKEFVVFPNYVLDAAQGDAIIDKYANVGILYVNYGALRLMTGNKGLTGSMQLDLIMEVEDGVKTDEIIQAPLQALMSSTNGELKEVETRPDEPEWEQTGYNYILSYHVPTTTGDINYTSEGKKYIVYSLPIDIFLTKGLLMGDSVPVKLQVDNEFVKIENLVNYTIAPSVQVEGKTMVNTNKTVVDALSSTWGMQLAILFDPSNELHKLIYESIIDNPFKVWTIEIEDGQMKTSGANTTRQVILQETPLQVQRAQPVLWSISAVETITY